MTERDLTYDLMLEPRGVLRSHELRVKLANELKPGEEIAARGRRWLVTDVHEAASRRFGIDRRAVAREIA